MAGKRVLAGARFHIPQFYRVLAAGRHKLAVGRKGHGMDGRAAKSLIKLVLTLLTLN